MNNLKILKIFNLISFIASLFVNFITINGFGPYKPIQNISNEYETLITPPNWAFSIWGLIYLGLLLFNIGQFIPNANLNDYILKINTKFILSCFLNASWLLIFCLGTSFGVAFSVLVIISLSVNLALIQKSCKFFQDSSSSEMIYCDIPFSLYLGWVISASVVNVASALNNLFVIENPDIYYILTTIFLTFIYFFNFFIRKNYITLIVYLYVLIGLVIKNYDNYTILIFTIINLSAVVFFIILKLILKLVYCGKKEIPYYIENNL